MSEGEVAERIVQVPLQFIKPLPFNTTVIDPKEERMLREEMKRPDGPYRIDPIVLRRLTPEEIEQAKSENPWVRYEIVDGHTRFRIAKDLHWPWIRARIIDISREEAYEMNYRRNRERGHVSQLAEALYFKHLQVDLKKQPFEIGAMFGLDEREVNEILARAVVPAGARSYVAAKLPEAGKWLSGKHLKVIASAPPEKQRTVAEAIVEGRLRADEAERAKEAILRGLPKEEAIQIAKAAKEPPAGAAAPEFEADAGDITCPKCGAKARVNWARRRVEWLDAQDS